MKIRIEEQVGLQEDEIIIKCAKVTGHIHSIYSYLQEATHKPPLLSFFKEQSEYFFPLEEVLFFETEGDTVYAHTQKDSYKTKLRLYELEDILPGVFVRVSKSAILNTAQVLSIARNLSSSSLVEFSDTHKRVYVSRRFYAVLKKRLLEKRISVVGV